MKPAIEYADRDDIDLIVVRRLDFLRDVRHDMEFDADFVAATRRFITAEFDAGRLHSWIARRPTDGVCVGLVSVILWPRPPRPGSVGTFDGYIINMFVETEFRGSGIGRLLLDACLANRERLGVDGYLLHTTDDGRQLYESAGFQTNSALLEWTER